MIYSAGALGHGTALFYRVTKYPPALELSRGLARWALAKMFKNEDGRYDFFHFHHGLYALMAVAEYAEAAQDKEAYRRVDACYRWVRQMGDPLIGWYSEAMPGSDWFEKRDFESVEIREVSDMVFLALYLTRAGLGDYWDDVDRWVRNQYSQGQITSADFFDRIPDRYFSDQASQVAYKDTRDIPKRSVGSFCGWMRANDALLVVDENEKGEKLYDHSIMHCCTGNGSRTLYYVWDSIVTGDANEARINLLLNRASEWLDVHSYLPAEGKVVLKIKKTQRVAARMPEWVDLNRVRVTVRGKEVSLKTRGRYVVLAGLRPGDVVGLTLPVPERVIHRVIGRRPYRLTLRGSQVVAIDPPGVAYPLYQNQPQGKPIQKTRFVPAKKLIW